MKLTAEEIDIVKEALLTESEQMKADIVSRHNRGIDATPLVKYDNAILDLYRRLDEEVPTTSK